MKKQKNYHINDLVRIETKNGIRSFIYERNIICDNENDICYEISHNTSYKLFDSLEDLPHDYKYGYITLKGMNYLDYKNKYRSEKDEILKSFYFYFFNSLKQLNKHGMNSNVVHGIYEMLQAKYAYLSRLYPEISYTFD